MENIKHRKTPVGGGEIGPGEKSDDARPRFLGYYELCLTKTFVGVLRYRHLMWPYHTVLVLGLWRWTTLRPALVRRQRAMELSIAEGPMGHGRARDEIA